MLPSILASLFLAQQILADADYYRNLWLESVQATQDWKPTTCYNEIFRVDTSSCEDFGEYDFVIVGGGSAGLVLANRLTEISCWNVLVLEMGGNESNFSMIPGASTLIKNSDLNLAYRTVPQEYACKDCVNSQCVINSGMVLGGYSSISDGIYVRGSREDFEKWILHGENEWSYDSILDYYIKLEQMLFPDAPSHHQSSNDITHYISMANKEMGYKHLKDARPLIHNGRRISINQAYLKPILDRKNLKVITGAHAVKIVFEKKKAIAQNFVLGGKCYSARIKRELILSGGAIRSPHLLQISGVGKASLLKSLGIPIVADLPVGRNLFDNPTIEFKFRSDYCKVSEDMNTDLENLVNGTGTLAESVTSVVTFGYFPRCSKTESNVPDVIISWSSPRPYEDFNNLKKLHNSDDSRNAFLLSIRANDIIAKAAMLHVQSRGEVTATSSDPFACPDVNPRYLENLEDLLDIHTLIGDMYGFEQTKGFSEIAARLNFHVKSCEPFLNNMRLYIHCITCHVVEGLSNFGGTCALGTNSNSVLDQGLMVRGIKNVRVVDSSAIPVPMSVSTTYVISMMGEKIADVIKKMHLLK